CLNLYGPTEATVDTLTADLDDSPHPGLATPVTRTRAHYLDAAGSPTPPRVPRDRHRARDTPAHPLPRAHPPPHLHAYNVPTGGTIVRRSSREGVYTRV
ncbi:hypothetical protein PUR58_00560, partial [Streptomyces sp. JV186]|uniref:hypothetical protein n=1 Tax=Streptomyces sp. JV186 TaxID=858639 RepID=UPI002E75AAA8